MASNSRGSPKLARNELLESRIPPPTFFSQGAVGNNGNINPDIENPDGTSTSKRRRNSMGSGAGTNTTVISRMINKSISTVANRNTDTDRIVHIRKRSRSSVADHQTSTANKRTSRLTTFETTTNRNRASFGVNLESSQGTGNKDPRNLRDRNVQSAMQQEILDYLINNKFDIETSHPVSLKTFKQPTQKGFTTIFNWRYLRSDPGYRFTKSVESELYQILKNLEYPYLDTISKSQISAVGGSSWYRFQGLLHWMVQLNIKLEKLSNAWENPMLNQPTLEMANVTGPVKSLDEQRRIMGKYEKISENLVLDYLSESYKTFLTGEDDYSDSMNKFSLGCEKFTRIISSDIDAVNAENQKLVREYHALQEKSSLFKSSLEKFNALKGDVAKYQNYINTMDEKSKEWPKKLDRMKVESEKKMREVTQLENDIRTKLSAMEEKGLSLELFEERSKKRSDLQKELSNIQEECDKLAAEVIRRKQEQNSLVRNVMSALKQYNVTLERMFEKRESLPRSGDEKSNTNNGTKDKLGDLADRDTLRIELSEKELKGTEDNTQAITYQKLFGGVSSDNGKAGSVIEERRLSLLALDQHIQARVAELSIENENLKAQISDLKNDIISKNTEAQNLEKDFASLRSKVSAQRQQNDTDLVNHRLQLEELQNRNQRSLKDVDAKLLKANQLLDAKRKEFEILQQDLRDELYALKNRIEDVIKSSLQFKEGIENSVEATKDNISSVLNEVRNLEQ